jgi:hypothetical protein
LAGRGNADRASRHDLRRRLEMLPPVEHDDPHRPLRRGRSRQNSATGPQTLRRCRIPHLAPGESVDEEPVFVCLHGFGDRTGEHRIVEGHQVEGAMKLHVMQLESMARQEAAKAPNW